MDKNDLISRKKVLEDILALTNFHDIDSLMKFATNPIRAKGWIGGIADAIMTIKAQEQTTIPNMDIYARIDDELKKRKMSRRLLAMAADMPQSTIAHSFVRHSKPSPANIIKIANALNMTWQELVAGTDIETSISIAIEHAERVRARKRGASG